MIEIGTCPAPFPCKLLAVAAVVRGQMPPPGLRGNRRALKRGLLLDEVSTPYMFELFLGSLKTIAILWQQTWNAPLWVPHRALRSMCFPRVPMKYQVCLWFMCSLDELVWLCVCSSAASLLQLGFHDTCSEQFFKEVLAVNTKTFMDCCSSQHIAYTPSFKPICSTLICCMLGGATRLLHHSSFPGKAMAFSEKFINDLCWRLRAFGAPKVAGSGAL